MKATSQAWGAAVVESGQAAIADKPLLTPDEQAWIAQRVREEQFTLIFTQSTSSTPSAIVVAVVMWVYLYAHLGTTSVLIWGLAVHFSQYWRTFWIRGYLSKPSEAIRNPWWVRGYLAALGVGGFLWGLLAWLYFAQVDVLGKTFILLVLMGMFSGGLSWMASVREAAMSFSLPIVGGILVTLLVQDELTYRIAAIAAGVYMYHAWQLTRKYYFMLKGSLTSQFEKQILVQRLHEQIALVKQASEEKSRFLAAASHDLRQPLQAIAMFGAVLDKELVGLPQHVHAERSMRAIRALGDSLDTMLDVSRLDAGVVEANLTAVPLNRLFQKVNEVYAPQANEAGLQLRFRATPLWVHSDAQLLDRMLSNLVSNALKYTRKGGVLVAARRCKGQIVLDVMDTGLGIPSNQRQKIFDEFYQLNNPGRDRSKGMGMGLAIVKRLSQLLGHRVEVASKLGRGSRFRIGLQQAQPAESPFQFEVAHSGRFTPQDKLPERVLLLDDEIGIREAMAALLSSYGMDVTAVATPELAYEALKQAENRAPFGAFLCDFRLADGVDGMDFALSLPGRLIQLPPILVVTGETAPDKLQRIREAGIQVLFKPVSEKTLLQALMQCAKHASRH